MKSSKTLRAFLLSIILSSFAFPAFLTPAVSAQTQDGTVAIQRGYRTGYSDGYMSGYRDTIDSVARNYSRHDEYNKADRAYNKEYGSMDDYRDGYQQGFESGYTTGYDRRSFEATLPTGLTRRGVIVGDKQNLATNTGTDPQPTIVSDPAAGITTTATTYQATNNSIIIIPRETELILELQEDLDTEHSSEGQKFTAKVVSPSELAGATVEGRVAKILKPGYLKKRAELLLSFDRVVLSDNRWSNFSAALTEVIAVKGDNVSRVDSEGTAVGISSLKSNAIKVGAATGSGALIGAMVGGGVGAAVGAGIGVGFGVGAVVIQRGKYIRLNRNQQLRIKTAYETQIR